MIFCGYADGKLTLGGKTGGGFGNLVGFVVKMSPNGTVAWAHFVQQTQVSGSAKFSTINNCFFSKDETKVMVTGNSAETTIGLGTLTRTLVGNQDAFIAIINPGTGAVEHLTTMGLASESQYAGTNYARGPANVMYTAFNVKDSTAFSDDSSTITCGAQQDCCFAVKYTGTVRNWAKAVEQSLCDGGVAVSPDGTKLYVSGMTTIYVLDAATGNALSNVTINNVDDIQSLVVAGTNVYAYGPVSSSTTFNSGSVSLLHPQPGSGAYLFRFAISGSTLTPSAATWMGTATSTESGYVTVYNMGSANNVTGNPNSVIVAMSASGSTFKSGSGFSKQFTTTLYGSASYSVGSLYIFCRELGINRSNPLFLFPACPVRGRRRVDHEGYQRERPRRRRGLDGYQQQVRRRLVRRGQERPHLRRGHDATHAQHYLVRLEL